MPIYEYKAIGKSCYYCRDGFEVRQRINAKLLSKCPRCQAPIIKLVSRFHACVVETSDESILTEMQIREYERQGRWSHAAELADKAGLKDRAKEDYKKAGYNM
jgi:putative FmdB family regulatory protein